MKKIITALFIIMAGLSAQAFDWAEYGYNTYQQPIDTSQPTTLSVVQPANPVYNNMFYQDPTQVQCQMPYNNPYIYRRPYGYMNPYARVNPITSIPSGTNATSQIVRNIGQSVLYSMMRGY